jgi:hypothetical protein
MKAAARTGRAEVVRDQIRMLIATETSGGGFVGRVRGRELGL